MSTEPSMWRAQAVLHRPARAGTALVVIPAMDEAPRRVDAACVPDGTPVGGRFRLYCTLTDGPDGPWAARPDTETGRYPTTA